MIEVRYKNDPEKRKFTLEVKGHAQSGQKGEDIICAGVSTLAYTLAQSFHGLDARGLCDHEPVLKMDSGDAKISGTFIKEGAGEAAVAFGTVLNGLYLLAANYPGNVKIIN